jgi:hypothetical protein
MKFKPTFRNYIKNHPGYVIGLIVVLGGAVWSHEIEVYGFTRFCTVLGSLMLLAIFAHYPVWKRGVLTQYDEDGNDIIR